MRSRRVTRAAIEQPLQACSIRKNLSVPIGEFAMKTRPENTEPAMLVGYRGGDGLLYCSRDCPSIRTSIRLLSKGARSTADSWSAPGAARSSL